MTKLFSLIVIVFFITIQLSSQTKAEALRDAKIAANATINSDFKTVIHYTLPSIVKQMGGKEKAIKTIKGLFKSMKEGQNFNFEKSEVIRVSNIVNEQDQYRCFVQTNNQMVISDMRIKSKSYLLGIFDSKDKKWWFLEADKLKNKLMLNAVLPNFKTSLEIPENDVKLEEL